MNKLFTKIATGALSLAMAIGVYVAIGANNSVPAHAAGTTEVLVSSTSSSYYSSGYLTGTLGTNQATWSGTSFEAVQSKNSSKNNVALTYNEIRVYAQHSFMVTPNSGYTIDSITLEAGSAAYATEVGGSSLTNCSKSTNSTTVILTPVDGTTTVGFTNSAQSRLKTITVEYSAQSSATLSSIAVSGEMTNTEYTTADEWDTTGLVVTGTYSDSSTKNLTAGSTFTFYNSNGEVVATPKDLGVGSGQTLKVVASYSGVSDTSMYVASSSINVTKAVEFELVTDPSKLTKGTTFILVGTGTYSGTTYTRAMTQSRTTSNSASSVSTVTLTDSFNSGSVATSADATVFTLGGSAGAWTIMNGDNRLGFTGKSNNNMQFNESQTDTFKITAKSDYLLSFESNNSSGRILQYNVNSGNPRFSNYSGTLSYIYMFANIAEVSYGTTDHISISTLPETDFAVGESFSSSGIVITAWDGADESSSNSKIIDVFTTDCDGLTFTDSDIGSKNVNVTYVENNVPFTANYDIYIYSSAKYELVSEEPTTGWAGSYLITSEVTSATEAVPETGIYAMKSNLNNFDVPKNYTVVNPTTVDSVSTIIAGQYLQFSISSFSTGYSIQGQNGKYIGWNSSSDNGLTTSDSALVNDISIDASGDVSILCSAGTKGLTLNTTSGQFRYYSNAKVKLYKLVESSEAETFAQSFMDYVGSVCVADGSSDITDLQIAWSLSAIEFDALSNADKQIFVQGSADENGNTINKVLALYDYVAAKYGSRLESEDCLEYNFMSRNITSLSNSKFVLSNDFNSNFSNVLFFAISLASITAIGAYLFIRKRKEQ